MLLRKRLFWALDRAHFRQLFHHLKQLMKSYYLLLFLYFSLFLTLRAMRSALCDDRSPRPLTWPCTLCRVPRLLFSFRIPFYSIVWWSVQLFAQQRAKYTIIDDTLMQHKCLIYHSNQCCLPTPNIPKFSLYLIGTYIVHSLVADWSLTRCWGLPGQRYRTKQHIRVGGSQSRPMKMYTP